MGDKSPGWGRRGDILGQRPEACTTCTDGFDDVEKIAKRSSQAAILGDDHHIALAELVDHEIELRLLALRPGHLVGIDALGPRARKASALLHKSGEGFIA